MTQAARQTRKSLSPSYEELEAHLMFAEYEIENLKETIRFLEGCSYESISGLCEDILTGGVATDEEKLIATRLRNILED
jgi:hypothetical protein